MRVLFIISLLISCSSAAQNTDSILPAPEIDIQKSIPVPVVEIWECVCEIEAQFPGGSYAMMDWVRQNVQYPERSRKKNESGRVYVEFIVERDGRLTDICAVERGKEALEKEAVRLVDTMPKWIAGEFGDKKIRTRVRLPVNFVLLE